MLHHASPSHSYSSTCKPLKNGRFPGGLPIADSSVDKLMCAPPWDRQFEAAGGLENFYPKMLEAGSDLSWDRFFHPRLTPRSTPQISWMCLKTPNHLGKNCNSALLGGVTTTDLAIRRNHLGPAAVGGPKPFVWLCF